MTEIEPVYVHGRDPARRSGLSAAARSMLQDTVPEETLKRYKAEWKKFLEWCVERDVIAVPVSTDNLTNWVAERCLAGDSVTIIKQGISAVTFFHDQHPLVTKKLMPDRRDAWRLLHHHHKKLVDTGWRPNEAAAFTVEELRAMCTAMPEGQGSTLRDRVILTVGPPGYARRSVLARLTIDDVVFTDSGDARIFVARDKHDQRALGMWRLIPKGSHPMSDPVEALTRWIAYLKAHSMWEGPLLRHFQKTGMGERLTNKPIHPKYVGTVVKRRAAAIGLEAPSGRQYRAHSLRASGATIAFDAGRPAVQIARDGGWSPKGKQVYAYHRTEGRDSAMRGLM